MVRCREVNRLVRLLLQYAVRVRTAHMLRGAVELQTLQLLQSLLLLLQHHLLVLELQLLLV